MRTEPIILPRSLWQYLLSGVIRADMTTMERIAGCDITAADYETNNFLALRYKVIQGILRGLNEEALQKLAAEQTKEAEVEILLTCGDLTYLEQSLDILLARKERFHVTRLSLGSRQTPVPRGHE